MRLRGEKPMALGSRWSSRSGQRSRSQDSSISLVRTSSLSKETPPSPAILGLPEKYGEWRQAQWEAVRLGACAVPKFVAQCAPTGFGKSLAYVANGLLEAADGGRTVILTSTKGLQDQLARDFGEEGVTVDVRGQNAYDCVISNHGASVAEGPCHIGYQCSKRDGGCQYYDAYRTAVDSPIVVTNYAYWLAINRYGEGLGPVSQLVLDEAHDAPDILAGFLSVELSRDDLRRFSSNNYETRTSEIEWWVANARLLQEQIDAELKSLRRGYEDRESSRRYRDLKAFRSKLEMMSTMTPIEWMCEWRERQVGFGMKRRSEMTPKFDCIDPRRHAGLLWQDARRVLLYSATVRPKTLLMLGIEEGQYEFNEYESTFDTRRHPIVWVPTVRMSHRSSEGDIRLWLSRVDCIIRKRQDRRGIIHTVSYRRAKYLLENSEYRHLMQGHDADTARDTIERFKSGLGRPILVSPTVTTGYDFPERECEYQIIGKIPFPDASGGVERVRGSIDKDRGPYQAVQTLVQMTGRGMRSESDSCEDFIIDNQIEWLVPKYRRFFPDWWLRSYRRSATIPEPLPKL